MAAVLGGLASTAEKYTGQALAFGLGFALANVLEPAAVELRQSAWAKDGAQIKAVAATLLAQGVSQGQVGLADAEAWAAQQGFDSHSFGAMIDIANTGPAIGQAFAAWRRSELTEDEFKVALKRTGLEDQWVSAIVSLKDEALEPSELAKAIHRGIVRADGLLVTEPPQAAGKVPQVAQSTLDPVEEAAWSGFTKERLRVLVGNAGLPPGIVQMLQLYNRGEITEDDFQRGVGQSNLRNEWGPAIFALHRHVLTPHEYVEARVRAWIDDQAMYDGTALSGLTKGDTDLLFKIAGRPLSWHQVFIGLRRGGKYGGPVDDLDPAFLKALQESNIRPEWYSLAWAQRFSYPSTFVLRGMAQAGELTEAETEQILLYEGWEPKLAKLVATRWAGTTASGGKHETVAQLETEYEGGHLTEPQLRKALETLGYGVDAQDHVVALGDARRSKKYRDRAIDAIAKAYLAFKINDQQAQEQLQSVNVSGDAFTELLGLWQKERLYTVRDLTPAQVKTAFVHGLIPRDSALLALEWLHYTAASAAELLDE